MCLRTMKANKYFFNNLNLSLISFINSRLILKSIWLQEFINYHHKNFKSTKLFK
jgi:hypothetical protein